MVIFRISVAMAALVALLTVGDAECNFAQSGRGHAPDAVVAAVEAGSGVDVAQVTLLPKAQRQAVLCAALAVYHEARGEPVTGRLLVAQVVRERATIGHGTACSVILAPAQFTWASRPLDQIVPREAAAWADALRISHRVLIGGEMADSHYTNFYSGPAPYWARHGARVMTVGSHHFMRLPR